MLYHSLSYRVRVGGDRGEVGKEGQTVQGASWGEEQERNLRKESGGGGG